jgi:type IV fimbrial biogenesis protein FimT
MILKKYSGFTIIELLIVVSIVGVLSMIAVPGMGVFIKENRIVAQANSILTSLHNARNETISRAVDVRVEPITAGNDWSGGWLIRIDGNNDGDFSDTEDTAIRYFDAIENANLIVKDKDDAAVNTIVYEPEGDITEDKDVKLTLTPDVCTSGKDYIRTVTVKISGHARVASSSCP